MNVIRKSALVVCLVLAYCIGYLASFHEEKR